MDESDFFPMVDEIDHEILMHCEAHFSGSFEEMIRYYRAGGKGCQESFSVKRIKELATMQNSSSEKLSETLLTDHEKGSVQKAKTSYAYLRKCYEQNSPKTTLLADLILSEEENPKKEIKAIAHAQNKEELFKPLCDLLTSDEFYNPLFPGYGQAPALAAKALGALQIKSAIPILFQEIGKHDFTTEEEIFSALRMYKKEAKDFLFDRLHHLPLTKENEKAALALLGFEEEEEVAKNFLKLLENPDVFSYPELLELIKIGCHALTNLKEKELLKKLFNSK